MREKPDDRTVCPYCGFDSAGYVAENSALRPLSVLGGKYIIGKVLGSGGFGIDLHCAGRCTGAPCRHKRIFYVATAA